MIRSLMRNYLTVILTLFPFFTFSQKAYFIDGFHGGIWGHYPAGYTSYIVEQLNKFPEWKVNLEIEPETWNRDISVDIQGYDALKQFLNDTTVNSRVEYVNPAYGQPYMYNISGESIIRHFSYGMNEVRKHFPALSFKTYSSEEPCFTSSLPQILKSFGYKYASLKNPNTCWGGYTRAYGKELVNWVGPDGTGIISSPRYEMEALKPNSTWETIGSVNSREFIAEAFANGIANPVGMCLQDAGWRFGPWLKGDFYKPTEYTTWRNYFENVTTNTNAPDWKFSQEDLQVSLVWGAQVLQEIAKKVRSAENLIVQAEKIASINKLEHNSEYPSFAIDEAWRNLMLAQHHDCWIVPYNGKKGDTWADKVSGWTNRTNSIADSINESLHEQVVTDKTYLKVYNTLGTERNDWLTVSLPGDPAQGKNYVVVDHKKKRLMSQILQGNKIIFKAKVPALGYAFYELKKEESNVKSNGALVTFEKNGDCHLETDLYDIMIDKSKGGTLKSLVAKTLGGKEFVDNHAERKFNELRGNFYKKGGFKSTIDKPANITILENGPYLISVKIDSELAGNHVSQTITLKQGHALIDFKLEIDWMQNEGIGEFEETRYADTTLRKAFYNDGYKLLTLFPLALKNQKVFKNAPFDVTESRLEDTFFSKWDGIKNNIILNWVDVLSGDQRYGMTLFTDHTTSYAHGGRHPLGLTTQYSGKGLWGRNYGIDSVTKINYQLLPHKGNWQQANVSHQNEQINEPLKVIGSAVKPTVFERSLVETSSSALEIISCTYVNDDLYIRIFNATNNTTKGNLTLNFDARDVTFVNLDGSSQPEAIVAFDGKARKEIPLTLKPFGINTIKVKLNE